MEETIVLSAVNVKEAHKSMLRMLLYFDIFDYPLSKNELEIAVKEENITAYLRELKHAGIIEEKDGWFFLSGKKYTKRLQKRTLAEMYYKKAARYSRLIYKFPFVRGIYISGSLSKDWADEGSDVDYFIITAPGRLWVSRSLLILFKKIFLLNSKKYFCLNYFISEDALEVAHKNIFTATEIMFLKPMMNEELFRDFLSANAWAKEYYPGQVPVRHSYICGRKEGFLKRLSEKMLGGGLGERLDILAFKRTWQRWKQKFPGMKDEDFQVNFKSDRHISKHHPNGFQMKVQAAYLQKIKAFEEEKGIRLS